MCSCLPSRSPISSPLTASRTLAQRETRQPLPATQTGSTSAWSCLRARKPGRGSEELRLQPLVPDRGQVDSRAAAIGEKHCNPAGPASFLNSRCLQCAQSGVETAKTFEAALELEDSRRATDRFPFLPYGDYVSYVEQIECTPPPSPRIRSWFSSSTACAATAPMCCDRSSTSSRSTRARRSRRRW